MLKDTLCLLICQNQERELQTVLERLALQDLVPIILPAQCEHPQGAWETLSDMLGPHPGDCQTVCLLACPCTHRWGPPPQELSHWRIVPADSWYHQVIGERVLQLHWRPGDRLVTSGELDYWYERQGATAAPPDSGTIQQGRTPATVDEWPGASTRRLVLLDTAEDEHSQQQLREIADQLDLTCTTIPAGLEHLQLFVENTWQSWRLASERRKSKAALSEAIRRSTDHAIALDLISHLTQTMAEPEVIDHILDLFTMLFVPECLIYIPMLGQYRGPLCTRPEQLDIGNIQRLMDLQQDYAWDEPSKGFLLRIAHQDETLGIIQIAGIALPQHREHYLSLALVVAKVCGLAIANARAYEKRKLAEEMIRHQAYHDPLTGLPNRASFHSHFVQALKSCQQGQRMAILFIDLDNFKEINDRLGHDMGDQLLQAVASRLTGAVRSGDIVARLGGDEFLLLLACISHREAAWNVAQRVSNDLKRPFQLNGNEARIAASIGIALYPDHGREAETLIQKADRAMYQVKERGRDGCAFYA